MVVFSCNACGEALKKNRVAQHKFRCRGCDALSCVDCGVDFWGEDYKGHVKCISEEAKYSGKDYKQSANKAEEKQDAWLQHVQAAIRDNRSDRRLKVVLETIEGHSNIPRKRAKFENFLRTNLRVFDATLIGSAWDAIAGQAEVQKTEGTATSEKMEGTKTPATVAETGGDGDAKTNGRGAKTTKKSKRKCTDAATQDGNTDDVGEKTKKLNKRERKEARRNKHGKGDGEKGEGGKKRKRREEEEAEEEEVEEEAGDVENDERRGAKKSKRKRSKEEEGKPIEEEGGASGEGEDEEEDGETLAPPAGTFKWDAAIIGVLKEATDNELPVKRIRKKVLAEYAARGGINEKSERLLAKFTHKLSHNPRVKLHKGNAKLVS